MATAKSSEILFVKCVKDGIPNRDPLNDSDARRIFGEDDGRISLSDVSIKRDVRDYMLARYPDGGDDKKHFIFCREERTTDNKLLGRQSLAETILERAGKSNAESKAKALMESTFDVRTFGAVYSVSKESFHQTGPVQFGWAHSLHPVETKYVQGTVVMPSKDAKITEEGEKEGASQGTIWTSYILPFAVFAMPGVINASIAKDTGMTEEDVDLLLEGLWRGTQQRQARGRGMQQPVFLLHVEYKDPFYKIGFLEDYIKIKPERGAWLEGNSPTALSQINLDVSALVDLLDEHKDDIARVRLACNPALMIDGNIKAETLDLR